MATTGTQIINNALTVLNDPTGIRWPTAECLGWLNDGQREIVILKPEVGAKTAAKQLTANASIQSIPDDGIALLAVTRNLGASSGATTGRAVRITSREILDSSNPDWHNAANTLGYIQHYVYDPRNPKTFYVYPKAPSSAWFVEMSYVAEPTNLSAIGNSLSIPEIYSQALIDYICYRAYSKDAEFAQNAQLAVAHYTAFTNVLGVATKNQMERNPNLMDGASFNPNVPKRS